MKTTFVAGLAATCLLSFSLSAQASDHRSFYVGVKGDIANAADSDIKGTATGTVKYGFSSGIGGVLGWQPALLDTRSGDLRVELEGSYHAFGLDTVGSNNNPSGDMKVTALMANLYYDWHTNSPYSPYIGIGTGKAKVKFGTGEGLGNTDATDNVAARQLMAGISYQTESMPNTVWSLGYKYLDVNQPSFSSAGGNVKLDPVHENTIELGFRYRF